MANGTEFKAPLSKVAPIGRAGVSVFRVAASADVTMATVWSSAGRVSAFDSAVCSCCCGWSCSGGWRSLSYSSKSRVEGVSPSLSIPSFDSNHTPPSKDK